MVEREFYSYEFGPYRLDVRQRSLSRDSAKIPVSARNFDLLLYLVENGGRILEHDELLDKVWAGTFVEQATLKKGISALRQILGETPETEFIKTIPRRGYSFVSPVRPVANQASVQYVRETEREFVVEEYEETDGDEHESSAPVITGLTALPAAKPRHFGARQRLLWAGGGLLLFALAFVGFRFYSSRHIAPRFTAENIRITKLTNNGRVVSGATISADGNYLLYPASEKEGVSLWLRQTQANSATRLTPPRHGSFWAMDVAPDNSYVYYFFHDVAEPSRTGLFKIPLLGGEPERIGQEAGSLLVSPDGKRILLSRVENGTHLLSIDSNGTDERQIVHFPDDIRVWNVGWSEDGSALLVTLRKTENARPLYYLSAISVATGKETVILAPQDRVLYSARWLPGQSAMVVIVREPNADLRQIWEYTPATGDWHRITNDNYSYKFVVPTRDGTELASTQETRLASIWIARPNGKPLTLDRTSRLKPDSFRPVYDAVGNYDRMGWLPDNRLMYSVTENRQEILYTIASDGNGNRKITRGDDGIWLQPTTNGAGPYICFLSNRSGDRQAWRIDGEGKNLAKLTNSSTPIISARILHDGATVVYTATEAAGSRLLERQSDGTLRPLTDRVTGEWTISPDEKLLAVELQDPKTGKYAVEVRSLVDNQAIRTFDIQVLRRICFTPDGKGLVYDKQTDEVSQLLVQPIAGGDPYPLTEFVSDRIFDFEFSPDGASLALLRGQDTTDAVLIKAEGR
jgi:DNA-binding winged helix-turn-helix (wHTH) protein/Tol biopolymer transport system component